MYDPPSAIVSCYFRVFLTLLFDPQVTILKILVVVLVLSLRSEG